MIRLLTKDSSFLCTCSSSRASLIEYFGEKNMKLLTHNMLQSNIKGVKVPYPLGITATKISILNIPYNASFSKSMLSRIDYAVLRMAAAAVFIFVFKSYISLLTILLICSLVTMSSLKLYLKTRLKMKSFWSDYIMLSITYAFLIIV